MANYITVSQLNNYLKRKFEADGNLNYVFLKGEISNCKVHTRGHIYFSLKDEGSVIGAIMFQRDALNLAFEPKDGTKVYAEGRITVYEASGKYQIIVSKMQPDGIGALYIAYEKLKKELEAQGLFAKEHKKAIPKYPKKIGIVTAPTGAAIRDILSTIKRRFPIAETILFPALVQGENAKESIVENINKAQDYDLDVLIVGRGGGSIEDLWAFNEEIVARAIYASHIPIISAVGHEVDFTIADFVADLRAPTPTGAAEMAVPNITDVYHAIENYKIRLSENIHNKLELYNKHLEKLKTSYVLKNPLGIYEVKEQKLSGLIDKLIDIMKNKLDTLYLQLNNIKSSYVLKNPLSSFEKEVTHIKALKSSLNVNIQNRLDTNEKRLKHLLTLKIFTSPTDIFINSNQKYILLLEKLELLNPIAVLKKGYAVVSKNGKTVSSIKGIKVKDNIDIKLSNGNILAEVKEIVK